jgi:uncharacterized protein (DUF362 family)
MKKVVKVKFNSNLKECIIKSLEPLGGIKNFVKKGDVVLLKPNFNTADPFPASTDYEFLKAVVEIVYSAEPKLVMIGESSTMSLNTKKIMEELKIFDLMNLENPPRIYIFEDYKWIKKEIPDAKYLKAVSITEILNRVDKIIFLPCLKTHKYAQYTGALKLAVGFMKPTERIKLHLSHIQEKIAELNSLFNVNLVIMDARKCFVTEGPSRGKVEEPNFIIASDDRIAIDIEGIKIIQSFKGNSLGKINPYQLPQIKRAIELNLGIKSEKDYEVIEINL